jgi:hypothetical protein
MAKGDYPVGFGKPPKRTQFKKGQSGNPNGRPKGRLNTVTMLGRAMMEKVVINEHGQRKTVTKWQAALKQLVNKAAGGDLAAFKLLAELSRSVEGLSAETANSGIGYRENDEKIMQDIVKRFQRKSAKEEK